MTFHSNVMGHFILMKMLAGALKRGHEETGKKSRVTWTSSYGLVTAPTSGVVFESLKLDDKGKIGAGLGRQPLYGQVNH